MYVNRYSKFYQLKLVFCWSLTLIFSIYSNHSISQWAQQTSGTTFELHDVIALSADTAFACGSEGIYSTTDGGVNWNSNTPSGFTDSAVYALSTFYSIYFPTSSVGYAAGRYFSNNNEIVFKTVNGGDDWGIIYNGGGFGSDLRDIYFQSANVGYAVGINGRIVKTTNGGTNWTAQPSGTSEHLFTVFFTDANTGYAGGNNILLKTTTGGTSWQTLTTNYSISDIYFLSSDTGYTVGGAFIKTVDGGSSWTTITKLGSSNFNNAIHINNSSLGFLAGYGIQKPVASDTIWELQPSSQGFTLNGVSFFDNNIGYAVGINGVILKTTNGGGPTVPYVSFSSSTLTICEDNVVSFYNNGALSNTYEWQINGVPFSTTYDANYLFTDGGNYIVSLIGFNGSYYDTTDLTIQIDYDPKTNLNVWGTEDTVCRFGTTSINIDSTELNTTYQLKVGNTNIGSPVTGNGGTISFPIGPLDSTTVFNISALNNCDSVQLLDLETIYVEPYPNNVTVTVTDTLVCYGDSTSITVNSSQSGVTYELLAFTDSLLGTGGNLTFPSGSITSNTSFSIEATTPFGCQSILPNQPSVNIEVVLAEFYPSELTVFVGDTIIMNDSSMSNLYYWEFDFDATPATDTISSPTVSYSSPGVREIKLITTTNLGCMDSISHKISIYDFPNPGNGNICWSENYDFSSIFTGQFNLLDYHIDEKGNSYTIGYFYQNWSWYNVYNMFIMKFDPNGNLLWQKEQDPSNYPSNYRSSFGTAITTDPSGNIYITGSYGSNTLILDTIILTHSNNGSQLFIAKLDSTGTAIWAIHGTGGGSMSGTDVRYLNDNQVFVTLASTTITLTLADGATQVVGGGAARLHLVEITSDGLYKNHVSVDGVTSNYSHNLAYLNPSFSGWTSNKITAVSPRIEFNDLGKIYLIGAYQYDLAFDSIIIYAPYSGKSGYIAVYDTANGWESAVTTYSTKTFYASGKIDFQPTYTFDNDYNFYVADEWTDPAYSGAIINGQVLTGNYGSFMVKYDAASNFLWYNLSPSRFVARSMVSSASNDIYVYGDYGAYSPCSWDPCSLDSNGNKYCCTDYMGISSQSIGPVGLKTYGMWDLFLGSYSSDGNLKWLRSMGGADREWAYMMAGNKCGDLYIMGNGSDSVFFNGDTLFNTTGAFMISKFSDNGNCLDSICRTLLLTNPDTGTCLLFGNDLNIEWSSYGVDTVDISYSADSGITYNDLALNVPFGLGQYFWDIPDSLFNNGSIIVKITNALLPVDIDSVWVFLNQTPSIVDLGVDTSFCSGQSVLLNAGAGFDSYLWSNGMQSQSLSVDTTMSVSVVATDSNWCIHSDTIIISVNQPDVELGNNMSICQGDSILLNAGGGFTSYLWSTGDIDSNIVVDTTGTYGIWVTDTFGCQDSDFVSINVSSLPVANAGLDTNICSGDSAQLIASGGIIYNWTPATNLSCTNCFNPIANPPDTTTYKVLVSDSLGCIAEDSVTVNVYSPINISSIQTNASCNGVSDGVIDITASGGSMSYSYLWTTGDTVEDLSGIQAGLYVVTVMDANTCQNTDSVVLIEPSPLPLDLGPDSSVCTGDSLTLDAGSGFVSYLWSTTDSSQTIIVNAAGTFSVLVTDSAGCMASDTILLILNPIPIVSLTMSDDTICLGDNVIFTAQPFGYDNYSFYVNSILVQSGPSDVYSSTGMSDGDSITVKATNLGCISSQSNSLIISVISGPSITLNSSDPDNVICNGDTVTFSASPSGYTSYEFFIGLTSVQFGVANSYISSTLNDGDNLTVISSNAACPGPASNAVSITVNPIPSITLSSSDDSICEGEAFTFQVFPAGYDNYEFFNNTVSVQSGAINSFSGTLNVGSNTVNAIVTNLGCTSPLSGSLSIFVNTIPTVYIIGATTICSSEITIIEATGCDTYLWDSGDTSSSRSISSEDDTCFSVIGSGNNGCTDIDSICIDVDPLPMVNLGPDAFICDSMSLTLDAGSGYTSYLWSDGSTNQTLLVNSSNTLNVKVIDLNGCAGVDTIVIIVESCTGIDYECSNEELIIYPNPNTGMFTVEASLVNTGYVVLIVVDILGQEIIVDKVLQKDGTYIWLLDLSEYKSGVYTVKLVTDGGVVQRPVVIE